MKPFKKTHTNKETHPQNNIHLLAPENAAWCWILTSRRGYDSLLLQHIGVKALKESYGY